MPQAKRSDPKLAKQTEALIAASVYDELDAADQALLEKTLDSDPEVRALWMEMRTLADVIPRQEIEFRGNLLPAVRQQIAEENLRRRAWLPLRWLAPAAVAGLAVVAALNYGGGALTPAAPAGPAPAPLAAAFTPAQALLHDADFHAANGNWPAAQASLLALVHDYSGDALAAQAQLRLADLYFTRLHQYPEAFVEYEELRERFPETFAANPVNVDRFNILSEARAANYEPLYMLDEARNSGVEAFAQLEELIARQPDTFIASLAVDSMRDYIPVPKSMSGSTQVAALEAVRARCTNPVAVAQVNLSLARLYSGELGDVATARNLYQSVAESGAEVLALSAQRELEELASAQ